jgi:FlaA1/EpsC-like NDP-sugar epimerase
MNSVLLGKRIMVTGACGTVGAELVRQLLSGEEPAEVIGIDNNETELFNLDQEYLADSRVNFFIADIRDRNELTRRMQGIDVVFHAAALKHVIVCERSPSQAVSTNIEGIQNIISAALENDVEKVVFTSSDKAVNPTNVMGTSKLMGERLMTAANSQKHRDGPVFLSTRFGNILGSRGSVVPLFHNQIASGGPVTITDEEMTRFVMSCEQAVELVINTTTLGRGGEVFITKMPILRILDLAKVMIDELAGRYGYKSEEIEIKVIGQKPGEKLYEELMSDEETRRAVELSKYFSILPAFRGIYNEIDYSYDDLVNEKVEDPYNSSLGPFMTHAEISDFLNTSKLLDLPTDSVSSRYWPGDKEENKK